MSKVKSLMVLGVIGATAFLAGCMNNTTTEEPVVENTPVVETPTTPNETPDASATNWTTATENEGEKQPEVEAPSVADESTENMADKTVKGTFLKKSAEFCVHYKTLDDGIASPDFKALVDEYKAITTDMAKEDLEVFNKGMDNTIGNECQKSQWDMDNMERLAEQIRRGDFTSAKDKDTITAEYNKRFTDKDVTKAKLLFMKNKTKEKILASVVAPAEENPFYLIYRNRYNWNKLAQAWTWFKPKNLEKEFVLNLQSKFNGILKDYKLTQEDVAKAVYAHYKVQDLDGFVKHIEEDYARMKSAYGLDSIIPEKAFSKGERKKIFADETTLKAFLEPISSKPEWDTIKKEILEFRTKIYYLVYLGMDKELDSEKVRQKVMNDWPAIQNLFRTTRYIDEPMKINLDDTSK